MQQVVDELSGEMLRYGYEFFHIARFLKIINLSIDKFRLV